MDLKNVTDIEGVMLVEFFASWCPHCQRMMPIVEEVRELLGNRAEVQQFDIDKYPDLAQQAGVDGIPTFIVFKNGEEQWRQSGEMPGEELLAAVQKYL